MVDYKIYLSKRNRTFNPDSAAILEAFVGMFDTESMESTEDKLVMYNGLDDFYKEVIASSTTSKDIVPIMYFIANSGDMCKMFITKTLALRFLEYLRIVTKSAHFDAELINLLSQIISTETMLSKLLSVLKYTDKPVSDIVSMIVAIGSALNKTAETKQNLYMWLKEEEQTGYITNEEFFKTVRRRIEMI